VATSKSDETGSRQPGSQTLARGLTALLSVVEAPTGLSVSDVAAALDVHRSIAYRVLQTLTDFDFVMRTDEGLYRPGARLAVLSDSYLPRLRQVALPVMRSLADEVGSTISLFVAEGREAVAIEIVEPTTVSHHISFKRGMRTPIDRGSAGYALLAAEPASDVDPEPVRMARKLGFATSHGEIDPGAYGVAAAIPNASPRSCINLITYRPDQAESSARKIAQAATEIGRELR